MMRAFWGKGLSAGLAVCIAIAFGATAKAGELFVMPYACSAPGGEPVLTPSSDQGYAVIGRKEQRPFSACSPSNPDVCKQWTVYRFDINCGGKRVPWVDVAAAVSATRNGRAFADHGRLRIEMPPRWAMAPDDPCSRDAVNDGEWHGGGFATFCAERRAHARGPIVEIPDGFAPMMGLDAIFVADGAPGGKSGGPAPYASASAEPRPAPFAREPAAAPAKPNLHLKPSQAESDDAAMPAPPAPTPVEHAQKPESKPVQVQRTAPVEAAAPAPSAPLPTQPAAAGTPLMPTVINKPNAPKLLEKPAEPAAATPAAPPAAVPAPQPATPPQPSHIVTASIDAPANDTPKAPVTAVSSEAPLHSGLSSALTPTTLAGAGLAALALIALATIQWQNRNALQTSGPRDIAMVSFEGRSSARDLVVKPDAPPLATLGGGGNAAVPAPPPDIFAPRDVGSDMPQTREQALQMLGMGVASRDNDAAIKKIVDGLRQSWHPDHAAGEADRQLRELRTKQINAAWAIINGARGGTTASSQDATRQLPPNAA